jgi:hypothetical protein
MEKNVVISSVVSGTVGVIAGGVITYLTVNKRLRERYEQHANAEIEDVKRRYALLRKDDGELTILANAEHPSPEVIKAVEHGRHIMEQMGYLPATDEKPIEEDKEELDESQQTLSIFDQGVDPRTLETDEEDEDEDDYKPIDGQPFLIAEAEYFENEPAYQLDTLTYYELDDTLTDEKNSQIDRIEETIGGRHLHMFKTRGGKEKTSLYIRNDEHETLYEVILVKDSYARLILGMDETELGLKEPKQRPKKMKRDVD